jgi:hypothetical protein
MGWPNFRYDQADLARLCRAREVEHTEYHEANQLFGFSALLREYAALPPDEPLPWAMEHAILFDAPEPLQMDMASRLPLLLSVTERQAANLRPRVKARVLPVGSAFFYLRHVYLRRHADTDAPAERRGTLVFPDKSTVNKEVNFDRERFAERLAALPAEYQPVAVSVYWKDFDRGQHLPFERAGLRLVTSGHAYDPLFLLRQYDLCRQFRYACANDISTSFCLSVLSGCRFFYLPTGGLSVKYNGVTLRYAEEPTLALPGKRACIAASPFPPVSGEGGDECDSGGAAQRELAELFAGKASVREPEFFQSLFEEGRRLLQSGPPPPAEFRHGRRLDELAGWTPRGIAPDGWARAECGLTIPPQPQDARRFSGVRLHLFVPRRAVAAGRATLTVTLAGGAEESFAVRPGCWVLDLPAAPDGSPRRVTLRLAGGGEARCRALRFLQITWQPSAAAGVAWRRQPFLRWARELRGRGSWVKGAVRGRLGSGPAGRAFRYVSAKWIGKLKP